MDMLDKRARERRLHKIDTTVTLHRMRLCWHLFGRFFRYSINTAHGSRRMGRNIHEIFGKPLTFVVLLCLWLKPLCSDSSWAEKISIPMKYCEFFARSSFHLMKTYWFFSAISRPIFLPQTVCSLELSMARKKMGKIRESFWVCLLIIDFLHTFEREPAKISPDYSTKLRDKCNEYAE